MWRKIFHCQKSWKCSYCSGHYDKISHCAASCFCTKSALLFCFFHCTVKRFANGQSPWYESLSLAFVQYFDMIYFKCTRRLMPKNFLASLDFKHSMQKSFCFHEQMMIHSSGWKKTQRRCTRKRQGQNYFFKLSERCSSSKTIFSSTYFALYIT